MIIFYEYEYCEAIIMNGVKQISQRDLNLLAKYWDYNGLGQIRIRQSIEDFCMKNDKDFNLIQNRKRIKSAINYSKNYYLRSPIPINITRNELDSIQKIDNYKYQKILFAMLLCAKYFHNNPTRKKPSKNIYEYLYLDMNINNIFKLAEVRVSRKEWKVIKHELCLSGLISPTILNKNRWAISYNDDNSEVVFTVDDYRNPISYYQEYCGEKMLRCDGCDVLTVRKSNNQRLCRDCWNDKERLLWREYKRNIRNKSKNVQV